jgi:pimeloyl-ACP methyl ester carboxylesterase
LLAAPAAAARDVARTDRVSVDGARLHLEVRGANDEAPVVLWLHGGPGGAERPLFRLFDGALEDHCVVAYLDQRGSGRSFDPDADPNALTIARHLADLDAVVRHLRGLFRHEKIVLLGHSWGAALGLLYAASHPDGVAAVIATAPLVATRAGWESEYDFVVAEATRRNDADALARLAAIGPPPYEDATEVLAVERLTDRYGGLFHRPPARMWTLFRGILGGVVTPWEIPRLLRANDVSLRAMHAELGELDLRRTVPRLDVPVAFLLGRHDRHADARLAAAYLDALDAPAKHLRWFEHSAHNPPFEEPDAFVAAVLAELGALEGGSDVQPHP